MKKGSTIWNWLIDKWFAGFLTALIFFILNYYIGLPQVEKGNFFKFNWLSGFLNSRIELWKVIVICVFLIIIHYIKRKKLINEFNSKTFQPPRVEFENYTVDFFGLNKARWAWDYEWDLSEKKFKVAHTKPLCPICDNPSEIESIRMDSAFCPKCRLEGKDFYFPVLQSRVDVEIEIVRRINNQEYKPKN